MKLYEYDIDCQGVHLGRCFCVDWNDELGFQGNVIEGVWLELGIKLVEKLKMILINDND